MIHQYPSPNPCSDYPQFLHIHQTSQFQTQHSQTSRLGTLCGWQDIPCITLRAALNHISGIETILVHGNTEAGSIVYPSETSYPTIQQSLTIEGDGLYSTRPVQNISSTVEDSPIFTISNTDETFNIAQIQLTITSLSSSLIRTSDSGNLYSHRVHLSHATTTINVAVPLIVISQSGQSVQNDDDQ